MTALSDKACILPQVWPPTLRFLPFMSHDHSVGRSRVGALRVCRKPGGRCSQVAVWADRAIATRLGVEETLNFLDGAKDIPVEHSVNAKTCSWSMELIR